MPRLLVVAPNWIGDALMAQPLLRLLRQRAGGAEIDVLAPGHVAPVLRRMAEVREVIDTAFRHGGLQWFERLRLGRSLRAAAYDEAIVLPNSWKSALVPFFARIPVRRGYMGEARVVLINQRLPNPPRNNGMREAMTAHYARLADSSTGSTPLACPAPRLTADPERVHATAARFGFGTRKNVVLCPGAEYGPAKRWPPEHYSGLATRLAARGASVWLLGARTDVMVCDAILLSASTQCGGRLRSLAGRTTLDEAIDLIAAADLVVSNDSGLMHVAAALDRPQVALFGSSSPAHTPPQSAHARILWLGLACSPCFARDCPLGHTNCLSGIGVERVQQEVDALAVLG